MLFSLGGALPSPGLMGLWGRRRWATDPQRIAPSTPTSASPPQGSGLSMGLIKGSGAGRPETGFCSPASARPECPPPAAHLVHLLFGQGTGKELLCSTGPGNGIHSQPGSGGARNDLNSSFPPTCGGHLVNPETRRSYFPAGSGEGLCSLQHSFKSPAFSGWKIRPLFIFTGRETLRSSVEKKHKEYPQTNHPRGVRNLGKYREDVHAS